MTDQIQRIALAEMTWPEVEEARRTAPLVIIPTGSCEQHGPHLALETDAVRATEMSRLLAARLAPRAVIAPTLTLGVSEHHMGFPGTLTLSPLTFQAILYDVVSSLARHGWRRVFILNGHGGNEAAVGVAVGRLQADLPEVNIAWSGITPVVSDLAKQFATAELTGHACEIETSQALYLAKSLVRMDKLSAGTGQAEVLGANASVGSSGRVHAPRRFEDLSQNGALGDARSATEDAGRVMIETALDRLCEFLEPWIAAGKEAKAASVR